MSNKHKPSSPKATSLANRFLKATTKRSKSIKAERAVKTSRVDSSSPQTSSVFPPKVQSQPRPQVFKYYRTQLLSGSRSASATCEDIVLTLRNYTQYAAFNGLDLQRIANDTRLNLATTSSRLATLVITHDTMILRRDREELSVCASVPISTSGVVAPISIIVEEPLLDRLAQAGRSGLVVLTRHDDGTIYLHRAAGSSFFDVTLLPFDERQQETVQLAKTRGSIPWKARHLSSAITAAGSLAEKAGPAATRAYVQVHDGAATASSPSAVGRFAFADAEGINLHLPPRMAKPLTTFLNRYRDDPLDYSFVGGRLLISTTNTVIQLPCGEVYKDRVLDRLNEAPSYIFHMMSGHLRKPITVANIFALCRKEFEHVVDVSFDLISGEARFFVSSKPGGHATIDEPFRLREAPHGDQRVSFKVLESDLDRLQRAGLSDDWGAPPDVEPGREVRLCLTLMKHGRGLLVAEYIDQGEECRVGMTALNIVIDRGLTI